MICVHIPKVDIFKFQGWQRVSNNRWALHYCTIKKVVWLFTCFQKQWGAQAPPGPYISATPEFKH